MSSIIKTLGVSASARMLALPVTAAATFFTTYLLVKELGLESYAYIVLVGSLFQLVPFADLGLGAAIMTTSARRQESRERSAAALATVKAAFKTLWISAVVVICLALIIGLIGAWPSILGLPSDFAESSEWAIGLVLLPFALALPFGVGQRILIGEGRTHVVSILGILGPLIATATTYLLLQLDADPLVLGVATPMGILVVSWVAFVFALKTSGWTWKDVIGSRRTRQKPKLWNSAGPMLVISITVPLALQSDRLVLSHFSDSTELSEYSVAAQMYTPCFSIISMAAVALWPIFSRSGSASLAMWSRALTTLGAGGVILAAAFVALVGPIASWITEGKLSVHLDLSLAFGLLLVIMASHQASASLLTSPSLLAFQAACSTTMLIVKVGLSITLAPILGGSGVVIASVVAVFATQMVPCLIKARRFLSPIPDPVKV